jgi:hypothetical protein
MLQRRPFKQPAKPERKPMAWPGPISGGIAAQVGDVVSGRPKIQRAKGGKDEQRHKDAITRLGCMVCRRLFIVLEPGPVELHHFRGGGWGKGDYRSLMPLCHEHHRGDTGIHGLGTKGFAAHYGFDQIDLLNDALELIAEGK